MANKKFKTQLDWILLILGTTMACVGVLIRISNDIRPDLLSPQFIESTSAPLMAIGATIVLGSFFFFNSGLPSLVNFFKYLSPDDEINVRLKGEVAQKERSLIKQVKESIIQDAGLSMDELSELIDKKMAEQSMKAVLADIEKRFAESARQQEIDDLLASFSVSLESKLEAYIIRLSRNANMNLLIGIITSGLAVIMLFVLLFGNPGTSATTEELLQYYIPRVSVAVFIEVFSFFFLKLYRGNLADARYFENERTNVKSKLLAYRTAYLLEDKEQLSKALDALLATERNFVLKKDETTVGLKKAQLQHEHESQIISAFASILKNQAKE